LKHTLRSRVRFGPCKSTYRNRRWNLILVFLYAREDGEALETMTDITVANSMSEAKREQRPLRHVRGDASHSIPTAPRRSIRAIASSMPGTLAGRQVSSLHQQARIRHATPVACPRRRRAPRQRQQHPEWCGQHLSRSAAICARRDALNANPQGTAYSLKEARRILAMSQLESRATTSNPSLRHGD
jgi:hypothetical protein